jgi:hypothetical protein
MYFLNNFFGAVKNSLLSIKLQTRRLKNLRKYVLHAWTANVDYKTINIHNLAQKNLLKRKYSLCFQ